MSEEPGKGEVADSHNVDLHNRRWSWGGRYRDGLLLFVWNSEIQRRDGVLYVDLEAPNDHGTHGGNERLEELEKRGQYGVVQVQDR